MVKIPKTFLFKTHCKYFYQLMKSVHSRLSIVKDRMEEKEEKDLINLVQKISSNPTFMGKANMFYF